jgi:hypothetical protein
MLRRTTVLMAVLGLIPILILTGCENGNEGDENETVISGYGDTESHRAGANCLSCHTAGGSGEGRFTIAGTVYQADGTTVYPNTTVKLYTGANASGDLVITVEVDGNGNFYTTEAVDWGAGLYPTVSSDNETRSMSSPTGSGACNSCHSGMSVIALN